MSEQTVVTAPSADELYRLFASVPPDIRSRAEWRMSQAMLDAIADAYGRKSDRPTCERVRVFPGETAPRRCARVLPDVAYVCAGCADHLAGLLARLAEQAGEAQTTIARLDRVGGDDGRRTVDHPLPYDWDAADATWVVGNTLTTWARVIAEERGTPIPDVGGAHPLAHTATWLAGQLGWLRYQRYAAEACDELEHACRLLERTIDSRPDMVWLGPCDSCGLDLRVPTGAQTAHCWECQTDHDVATLRLRLLEVAEGTTSYAARIAAGIQALGYPVTAAMIRGYAHRGLLVTHGVSKEGRPLYLVGEVLALVRTRATGRDVA